MKRFKVRRRKREASKPSAYADASAGRRSRKRHYENGQEVAAPRAGLAPVWPSEVAIPWDRLLTFLLGLRDRDLSLWQMLDHLGIDRDNADLLREQIALLEREGVVVHHRRGRVGMRSRDRLVAGRLSIPASSRSIGAHRGAAGSFGFVAAPGRSGDLFIPARGLAGAGHGDLVLARGTTSAREERSQGTIVAILARAPALFAGEVIEIDGRLRVRPRDERTAGELLLARDQDAKEIEARVGDLVFALAIREGAPRARLVEVIGPASDPAAAEKMIRRALALPGDFPSEVEREAEAVSVPVAAADLEGRTDFRAETVITIDPVDARDFDDAISIESRSTGGLRLWVHIADVSHYVRRDSSLDREAAARGTSVYFPGQVIPMLPHDLSSGICSLREGEDRLVQSVGLDYSREGELTEARFADGVIRSTARLTYEEAAAGMENARTLDRRGDAGRKVASLLAAVAPLARRLTATRIARGALDLDLPELEFRPGEGGSPATMRTRERTAAHRLVEEFMLAANEAVARRLSEKGVSAIYRIHEPPDPADVEEVEKTLSALGAGRKGGRSLAARLQHLLTRFRGKAEEGIVARQVLRALKLARYAEARSEHFGLALQHYTHFTSPIRRYPDLIVHRILRASGRGERGAAGDLLPISRLAEIAVESSRLERRAEEGERAVNDLLMASHMRPRVGEVFEGRVAGAVKTGIFVQLHGPGIPEGAAEGFAPTPRASRYLLTEPVRVKLEEADLLRGRLRFSILDSQRVRLDSPGARSR